MITYCGAALLVAGFVLLLKVCKLVEVSREIIRTARLVADTVRNASLADREKEIRLQGYSKTLFKLCARVCGGIAVALTLPTLVLWGLDRLRWARFEDSMAVLVSWQFLTLSSAALCLFLVRGRLHKRS